MIVNGVDYAKIGPDDVRVGKGGNSPMKRMLNHPDHYQGLLADLIRKERPMAMIETGVESGYSTEHFLTAMDDAGCGHLFSCDPVPSGFYVANPIVHRRFTFIQKPSQIACPEIFAKVGPIDMFLHDSNHDWETQTWEYEWAWQHVRSGGIIASDDVGWGITIPNYGTISHDAWAFFVIRHGMQGKDVKINNAKWLRRP